ncbi:MAG: hypothetical protein HOI53_06315, partial [Francisellaceae bacterium]|nr:hypothetical protein [Francisellaceae bacterium]
MKNSVAGGIDGKDDYSALITSMTGVSSRVSEVNTTNHAEIHKLNELLQRTDISTVVIVPSHTLIDQARVLFPGAPIYTVEESKGLEFDVVVKYGFYNSDDALLKEVDGVYRNGGYSSSPQNRSKERNSLARSNSLYFHKSFVAATRTMSELIVVDDVMASDSFPSLWEALKGDISVSHEISTSQSSSDFSQLPHNEQISTLSAKISKFAKNIHDDGARGITRNIDALERNMFALIQQREPLVEQAANIGNTEELWSILSFGDTLRPEILRQISSNPNANVEILKAASAHVKEIGTFKVLLSREDILNTDEIIIDFKTLLLRCMLEVERKSEDTLSLDEASALHCTIERVSAELNTLFVSLIMSADMIGDVHFKISKNEFSSADTLNALAGRCLVEGHIEVAAFICTHKNSDSVTMEMASSYLQIQGSHKTNNLLLRAIVLSPHANEVVISSLITNKKIDIELTSKAIQQSKWISYPGIIGALGDAKQLSSAKADKSEELEGHHQKTSLPVKAERMPEPKTMTKQEKNEKAISTHADKINKILNNGKDRNRFNVAHKHLTDKSIIRFAVKIILSSKKTINHYLNSKVGRKSLEQLLQAIEKVQVVIKCSDGGDMLEEALQGNDILSYVIEEKLKTLGRFIIINNTKGPGEIDITLYLEDLDKLKSIVGLIPKLVRHAAVNKLSGNGATPLFLACQNGKKDIAKYLLSIGADYNIFTEGGWNIAHVACENDNLEILRLIIESVPDDTSRSQFVNKKLDDGETPLFLACKHDKKDITEYLLSIGADYNICKKGGWNIAHVICEQGNLEILKIIIESLPDDSSRSKFVNKQSDSGVTPLYLACKHGNKDIAEYLLSIGADYNICTKGGWNIAHVACGTDNLEILKLIIEGFTDDTLRSKFVNKQSDNGSTPLYLACSHGKIMTEYLLSIGADYNICKKGGWNVAHVACEKGNLEILRLIIESLPDDSSRSKFVNKQSDGGVTPLYLACKHGKKDIAEYLLSIGTDYNICTKGGWSIAHVACENDNLEILKLIIESVPDATSRSPFVNKQSGNGMTPLYLACQNGKKDIAEYLLSIGADCFIQDDFGYGPMHVAAKNGRLEMLKAMLAISTGNAMQPRLVNCLGAGEATPLWIACQYGHLNVVQFLLSCREVSLHPLIRLNEELVALASEYNIEVAER